MSDPVSTLTYPATMSAPPNLLASRPLSERQKQLLDEMAVLFFEKGFRNTTIQDLAAYLQCSRRTLYDLASTKEELVLVTLDRLMRRLGSIAINAMNATTDPATRLHDYLMISTIELGKGSTKFWEDVTSHPPVRRMFDAHFAGATELMAQLIKEGIEAGQYREVDARVAAHVLSAAVQRLRDRNYLPFIGRPTIEADEILLDIVLNGLRKH